MRFLLLNQTFHPDVMATAQYLSEVALALRERGHEVTVITSRRAYDNPAAEFPAHETWRGIEIHRIGSTRFGKGAKWRRAADFASFILMCCLRLVRVRRPDVVIALTSPPLISFIGAWYARLRGARFGYWVMDLNPDEAIAAGWLRRDSFAGHALEWMSRFSFRHSTRIIALDHFMRDRIAAKLPLPSPPQPGSPRPSEGRAARGAGDESDEVRVQPAPGDPSSPVVILPPWSHDDHVHFDATGRERFRATHGLSGKFVVMYSGNHSPCHPLDTVLAAALCLDRETRKKSTVVPLASPSLQSPDRSLPSPPRPGRGTEGEVSMNSGNDAFHCVADHSGKNGDAVERVPTGHQSSIVFCFIGGGSEFKRVQAFAADHQLNNILCLPYQPLDHLSASLSAADTHLVVMGDAFVGIVHPCKIYNILAVGAPVLYVGPEPSHVTEILAALGDTGLAASVRHGDGEELLRALERIRHSPRKRLPGHIPTDMLRQFGREVLLGRMVSVLESPRA